MKNTILIDIGGTKMLLYYNNGNKTITERIPTGRDCTKQFIKEQINNFIQKLPPQQYQIGIAIPGLVKGFNRVILSYVIPNLKDLTTEFLQNNPSQNKIYFINDVTAALFSQFNKFKKLSTILVIMVGTGIGMGIYSNKKIITGANGWAGELGSINIISNNSQVQTLDQISSGAAIIKLSNNKSPQEIKKLLNKKDKTIINIIKQAGFYFGIGIANIINLYNPNLIVISGGTIQYKYYIESAIESAKNFSIKQLYDSCEIKIIKNEQNLVIKGLTHFITLEEKNLFF